MAKQLLPIGSTFETEGFIWRVVAHENNKETVELVGPAGGKNPAINSLPVVSSRPAKPVVATKQPRQSRKKQAVIPRRIPIAPNTHVNVSRRGLSLSYQIAPGLSVSVGKTGARMNVNMGALRFSKKLKD